MKKFILVLIFTVSIQQLIYADSPFNIGLKVGSNSTRLSTNFEELTNINYHTQNANNYYAGAFARINLGRIFIQPEAYFNTKDASLTSTDPTMIDIINKFDMQTIDVPILIGLKLLDKKNFNLRFNGGPMFGFISGSSMDLPSFSELKQSDFVDRYVGWQIGLGIDLWFATFDARVEGTGDLIDKQSNYSMNQTLYTLAIGIKIFGN